MTEPKEFYRKLDSLLSKIGMEKTGKDFLFTIVLELEITFGRDLHIANGCIYEKNDDEYILISPPVKPDLKNLINTIPIDSEIVQLVLNSGTYIFDNHSSSLFYNQIKSDEYSIPVAINIYNQDNSWIFLFELKSGWVREEIEICLNAVRTMLNFRLFTESMKSELEQAVHIQRSLLPRSAPNIPGFQIAGRSQPAELVGGDLYDYFHFDNENFGFCIADASGHGIPAALMARDVITGLRMGLENQMTMSHTIRKLNRVIYRSVYSTGFISLFYAEMETSGNLLYINSGHPSPFIVLKNEIRDLESTSLVLGALQEIEVQRFFTKMEPGNVLVLYTDGFLERQNKKGEYWGIDRLKNIAVQNKDKNAGEIINQIFKSANEFGKKIKWQDDATAIVIKRLE
jgi:serine phosphatase RsbU (regulator of sigma subunit)